ncbi:hypothetical protein P1X14_07455 [Sphingomonas sp. AOB5]|uniref:hypothetical protein n=1 Tax=Sphingomonas sp. AOB5 TaxID=3034017 RepID=UPI0023F6F355|nr:hypothetical protein [Sphingomonas sp. AOB5]MDF7775077.1 hypothetical protein [Sphingomonas sp. AOB5]
MDLTGTDMRAARIAAALIVLLLAAWLVVHVAMRNIFVDQTIEFVVIALAAAVFAAGMVFGRRLRTGIVVVVVATIAFAAGSFAMSQPVPRYPQVEMHHVYGFAAAMTAICVGISGVALIVVSLFWKLIERLRPATISA